MRNDTIDQVLGLIRQFDNQEIKRKLASIARSELNAKLREAGVQTKAHPEPAEEF